MAAPRPRGPRPARGKAGLGYADLPMDFLAVLCRILRLSDDRLAPLPCAAKRFRLCASDPGVSRGTISGSIAGLASARCVRRRATAPVARLHLPVRSTVLPEAVSEATGTELDV